MAGARMLRAMVLAGAALAIGAPSAFAATATSQPPTLLIGGDAQDNKVSVFIPIGGSSYRVAELTLPMIHQTGCTATGDPTEVDCDPFEISSIGAFLQDGDDSFSDSVNLPLTVDGGDGNDSLGGGPGNDQVEGDLGNDFLYGSDGNDSITDGPAGGGFFGAGGTDQLYGQNGNDHLDGGAFADSGAGPDVLDGGQQIDTVTYAQRTQAVKVTEDGNANDGQAGEGDNVTNVEKIVLGSANDGVVADGSNDTLDGRNGKDNLNGGPGNDTLLGGTGNDFLTGSTGADILGGGAGTDTAMYGTRSNPVLVTIGSGANDGAAGEKDDVLADVEKVYGGVAGDRLTGEDGANALIGGDGADRLYGLGGDDVLDGGRGADILKGASGDDVLTGGSNPDQLAGASGDDVINAKDGAKDTIDCGTGDDHVTVDAIDVVATNCEHLHTSGRTR